MIRSFPFAFALLGSVAVAAIAAEPKLPKSIVRSFDKTSATTRLQAKAPDYFSWQKALVSPDRKYVARFTYGEGEEGFLTVYRRAGKKNVWAKRYAVSRQFKEVESCLWLRGYQHHLLVATSGDVQVSYIASWTGADKTQFLKKGHGTGVEGFNIYGTSPDGHILYYEHFGPNSPDSKYNRDTVQTMRLPK